jgi:HIRAN domain
VREPENKYSRNAVGVCLDNAVKIGYVPEELATEIAPLLDAGHRQSAYLTKILSGGRTPIPVVQAYLYRPDAEVHVRPRFGLDPPPASAAITDGSAVPLARGRSATVAGPSATLPVTTIPPPRPTTRYVLLACALIIVAILLVRLFGG